MDAEELKDKLDPLYEAAMQEQKDITECSQQVERAAKDFISKRYAEEVNHLSAESYRKLEDVIERHSTRLAIEIINIFYHHNDERNYTEGL